MEKWGERKKETRLKRPARLYMPTVRIRAIIRDIPPLPLSCNAYTLDEITLLLRFSFICDAYLRQKKKKRRKKNEIYFCRWRHERVDEMISHRIRVIWSMSGRSLDARKYTGCLGNAFFISQVDNNGIDLLNRGKTSRRCVSFIIAFLEYVRGLNAR